MLTKEEIDNWMTQTTSFPTDIKEMHHKFGVDKWLKSASNDKKQELMKLRMRMLTEEYAETMNAYLQADSEEMVDGLIDIIVIAIGTLDIAGVDAGRAWNAVHSANMAKSPGIKPNRPNPLGLPDLVKPDNWRGPDHSTNVGDLPSILGKS